MHLRTSKNRLVKKEIQISGTSDLLFVPVEGMVIMNQITNHDIPAAMMHFNPANESLNPT